MLSDRFMVCFAIFFVAVESLLISSQLFQLPELSGWETFKMIINFLAFVYWAMLGVTVYKRLGEGWRI